MVRPFFTDPRLADKDKRVEVARHDVEARASESGGGSLRRDWLGGEDFLKRSDLLRSAPRPILASVLRFDPGHFFTPIGETERCEAVAKSRLLEPWAKPANDSIRLLGKPLVVQGNDARQNLLVAEWPVPAVRTRDGQIELVPAGVLAPYRLPMPRIESGATRDVQLDQFSGAGGARFRRGVARMRAVRITATDMTGKTYKQEVPFD